MSFVNQLLGKLFPDKKEEKTVVSEQLTRSKKFLADYREWLGSDSYANQLQKLDNAYAEQIKSQQKTGVFGLFHSPQSNGILFGYDPLLDQQEFYFLFDSFKDTLLDTNYKLYFSTRTIRVKEDEVETTERHFLKPSLPKVITPPLDQLFGNVQIELVAIDRKPSYIKLMAHIFSDRNYREPLQFEDLVSLLFMPMNR